MPWQVMPLIPSIIIEPICKCVYQPFTFKITPFFHLLLDLINVSLILHLSINPLLWCLLFSDVSRTSDVSISIYLRQPPKAQGSTERTTNDYFLGAVKLQPNFDTTKVDDQVLKITGGTGVMHVQLCYKPQQVRDDIEYEWMSIIDIFL